MCCDMERDEAWVFAGVGMGYLLRWSAGNQAAAGADLFLPCLEASPCVERLPAALLVVAVVLQHAKGVKMWGSCNSHSLMRVWIATNTSGNSLALSIIIRWAYLIAQSVKHLPAMQDTQILFLNWEDLLEKEMATHSTILAWKIPWTKKPGGLQSMGSQESETTWWLNHHHHHHN